MMMGSILISPHIHTSIFIAITTATITAVKDRHNGLHAPPLHFLGAQRPDAGHHLHLAGLASPSVVVVVVVAAASSTRVLHLALALLICKRRPTGKGNGGRGGARQRRGGGERREDVLTFPPHESSAAVQAEVELGVDTASGDEMRLAREEGMVFV